MSRMQAKHLSKMINKLSVGFMITDDKKQELLAAKVGENKILLSIDSKEIKFVVGEKE